MKGYERVDIKTASEGRFVRLCEVSYKSSVDEAAPSEDIDKTEVRKWDMVQRTTRSIPKGLYRQSPAPFPVDGVEICAFLKRDGLTSLVLVAQYRPPLDAVVLEFPAGLIDNGENVETAALRELKEETGFVADVKDIISVSGTLPVEPGITDSCCQIVKILLDADNESNLNPIQELDDGEDISVLLLPLHSESLLKNEVTPIKSLEMLMTKQQNLKKRVLVDAKLYSFLDGLSVYKKKNMYSHFRFSLSFTLIITNHNSSIRTLSNGLPPGSAREKVVDFAIEPVELEPVFSEHRKSCKGEDVRPLQDDLFIENCLSSSESENTSDQLKEEPLAKGIQNTFASTPYRISWYDYEVVSPAKRFTYWAYRRLRELPPEWREYYRRMLYQELSAARYVNQTWDCFMMVVDGYRKSKWVLKKYGVPIDETLIPRPYNNFWEETTHQERVWAHRRSHQLKELQALQRDEDDLVFGAHSMDRREVSYGSIKNLQSGMQGGSPVHADDLLAPREADVRMSRHAEEMSSALMSSIEDDKLWNPVLRSRLHTQSLRQEAELYSFEDDDDDEIESQK